VLGALQFLTRYARTVPISHGISSFTAELGANFPSCMDQLAMMRERFHQRIDQRR